MKKTYEDYVSKINANSISMDSLKKSVEDAGDKLDSQLYRTNDLPFGDEINNAVKSLEVGKALTATNGDTLYLIIKLSLDGTVKELKNDEKSRYQILYEMKKDEFEENAKKIEVTVNESGIKSFPPSMFDQDEQQQQRQQ